MEILEALQKILLLMISLVVVLAIRRWISKRSDQHNEKNVNDVNSLEQNNEPAGEFDNDFSKVPGGAPDETKPFPRSIGYGCGVGDQTMYEDLERIGLVDKDHKKK